MDVVSVMDLAYGRRHELLAQEGVRWVRMMLDPRGVTLTIEKSDGSQEEEFIGKQAVC